MFTGLTQFVWISDMQIGSTVALSPRYFILPDGNVFKPSPLQQVINEFWDEFWQRRWQANLPTVVCFGGEFIDAWHHGTLQTWTIDETSMIDAAVMMLEPIVQRAAHCFWIGGTPAHSGGLSRWDRTVMRELGVHELASPVEYRYRAEISGVLFDLAHHGPSPSRKIWTRENSVRSYARNIILNCLAYRRRVPDVILRGHVHQQMKQTVEVGEFQTNILTSPSWQWRTEFVQRIDSENDLSDIGGIVAMVQDGRLWSVDFDSIEFISTKDVTL